MKKKLVCVIVAVCSLFTTLCGCARKSTKEENDIKNGIASYVYSNEEDFDGHYGTVPDSKYYNCFLHVETTYFYEVVATQYGGENQLKLGVDEISIIFDDEFFEITEYRENGFAQYYLKTKSKTGETVLSAIDRTGHGYNNELKHATSLKIYVY